MIKRTELLTFLSNNFIEAEIVVKDTDFDFKLTPKLNSENKNDNFDLSSFNDYLKMIEFYLKKGIIQTSYGNYLLGYYRTFNISLQTSSNKLNIVLPNKQLFLELFNKIEVSKQNYVIELFKNYIDYNNSIKILYFLNSQMHLTSKVEITNYGFIYKPLINKNDNVATSDLSLINSLLEMFISDLNLENLSDDYFEKLRKNYIKNNRNVIHLSNDKIIVTDNYQIYYTIINMLEILYINKEKIKKLR